ncbi:hypothetical protein LAV73_20715 [Lysinibacillus xylanilyticus]|uniref:hypothetical protein n=1 Tax=Lysinibacillus xylanilyticus TaxID=582475 RepID=UPI002B24CDDC|nr:hypothetical protein [Lysinibacillus xylanilyticus]MEB2282377.1 hypothetical protein [Lysinibacillus xylanilyticus]
MPYQTDERLKSYLDTNQLHREQMCRAILAIDKRFSEVRPRHPRGGPDGGRDIEAVYRDSQLAYGAIGFVNQANDSDEQKRTIKAKFVSDLESALDADKKPTVFIFFTNISLTIGEKDALIERARKSQILFCEVLDRERLRISLDSPDGFSIRFQYLNIALSEAEQASFFARWGEDIQSVISTGFQRIESTLNRVLFFQEYNDTLSHLTLSFELDTKYSAEIIGHFRLFCLMYLKEPKQKILSILFGSSDKSDRMINSIKDGVNQQKSGIKYGKSGGEWQRYIDVEDTDKNDSEGEKYACVSTHSSIGINEVNFVNISYSNVSPIRILPSLKLRDLDEAMFLTFVNKSLADKIKTIHVYSNGYKLQEINNSEFYIDETKFTPDLPVIFTEDELCDPWVRIRPKGSSVFNIRFFQETPKRMFLPSQTINSLEKK